MKFKIGDTVEFTKGNMVGSIIKIDENDIYSYLVELQNDNNSCVWTNEYSLKLVKDEVKNTECDKKDLIRNLINKYLSDNETSIQEELFLKRFQDYCFEKLGDD